MKKVLVLYYSQTGQLERIVRSLMGPFGGRDDVEVHFQPIVPRVKYPFPWPILRFFDQFPECVHLVPPEIDLPGFDETVDYDLIVLGYQTWYLSPSLPSTGFLKSRYAKVMAGKPVVTVIGCRNMWLMGQEAMRKLIADVGGKLRANVVLIDQGTPAETFVTVTVWLLTGRREVWPGVLSPAGVAESEIEGAGQRFGAPLLKGLLDGRLARGEQVLDPQEAAPVNRKYILSEQIGWRAFHTGAYLVRLAGGQGSPLRVPLLGLFVLLLGAGIVTIVPFTIIALLILSVSPAYKRWLQRKVEYFEAPVAPGR